jgi:hypothetical protein
MEKSAHRKNQKYFLMMRLRGRSIGYILRCNDKRQGKYAANRISTVGATRTI